MNFFRGKTRFRISLRFMMVLVLLFGGVLGWKLDRARTQARSVAVLDAADGRVFYDYQFSGTIEDSAPKIDTTATIKAPDWLRKLAGDEVFREVTSVSFFGDNPKPATWQTVAKLDHLINVDFRILDAKLAHVSGLRSLPRLKSITIGYQLSIDEQSLDEFGAIPGLESFAASTWLSHSDLSRITRAPQLRQIVASVKEGDAAMGLLSKLSQLRSIELVCWNSFSDKALHDLAPILPDLESLELSTTRFTDQGMAELAVCRRLKTLKLAAQTRLTETGIASLKDLKELEFLQMQTTVIDDASLAHLSGLTKLKTLDIEGSNVTDAGLASLVGLKKLERLSLSGAKLTDAGLDQIRKLSGLKHLMIKNSWKDTRYSFSTLRP